MHAFTAATIAARASALDVLCDGGPVIIDVETKLGTSLSDKQYADINAALETLRAEIQAGSAYEITEARRILTDNAYAAMEAVEVDAR